MFKSLILWGTKKCHHEMEDVQRYVDVYGDGVAALSVYGSCNSALRLEWETWGRAGF